MTAGLAPPKRVLAVVDADAASVVLKSAMALSDKHGAAMDVIACIEPPHDLAVMARLSGEEAETLLADAARRLSGELREKLAALVPARQIEPTVVVGKAYYEIIRYVAETGCDFVVKMAEPLSGVRQFLFSSTDQHLLRKCPCPVWLQTPDAADLPRRVLAAIDLETWDAAEPGTLTALNRRVIDAARSLASGPDAEVVVLHAWEAIGEGMVWAFSGKGDARFTAERYVNEVLAMRQSAMTAFLADVQAEGPRLVPLLSEGVPAAVIEEQGRKLGADVVVMGTIARTGLSGVLIGNTAENIINSLECPVLAVKPEGFVSPLL
ncbi:MAG: universal stress protein [Pseudomonadota bacterium]